LSSEGLALFWPFLIEGLTFFRNFVGRFWPFFTEGLAFFEKINLTTLDGPLHSTANTQQRTDVMKWD